MDQRIISLYDEYVHVHLNRRLFLERTAKLVGSMSAAAALLPMLQSNYALAQTIRENDSRITVEHVTFPGPEGTEEKGYLAVPRTGGQHSAVLVIHQNRGLNAHIEDIARRLATEGYVALAIDMLSPFGGTPDDRDEGGRMIAALKDEQPVQQGLYAMTYLRARDDATGKVGAVGFCWGGSTVNRLAVEDQTLDVGVAYYGTPANLDDVPKIETPLLLHYGDPELDPRLGRLGPPYEAALEAAGKVFALHWYPGANHSFNDDTNPVRHDETAATLAWGRTLDWLRRYLT